MAIRKSKKPFNSTVSFLIIKKVCDNCESNNIFFEYEKSFINIRVSDFKLLLGNCFKIPREYQQRVMADLKHEGLIIQVDKDNLKVKRVDNKKKEDWYY